MNDDLGGNTEDLLTLRQSLPTETGTQPSDREQRVRRFGRLSLLAGTALAVLFTINSLGMAMVTQHHEFTDPDARLFAVLAFIAITDLATALVVIGGMERLQRPQRSAVRQLTTMLAGMQEQMNVVMGTTTVIPGRLAGIERRQDEMTVTIQAVPDYGRGVVDGMQIRNEALGPEIG